MSSTRARPKLDDDNRSFWIGGSENKLNIMKCSDCGEYTHPPRRICRHCQSETMFADAVVGTGVVDTFTINHQKWVPWLDVPYVIARVRLDGVPGVYLTTNIIDCDVNAVKFDDRVRVVFEEQDGIWYPLFKKIDAVEQVS